MTSKNCFTLLFLIATANVGVSQEFLGKDLATWQEQLRSADAQDRHLAAWAIAQAGTFSAVDEMRTAIADPVVAYWRIQGFGRIAGELGDKHPPDLAFFLYHSLRDEAPATRIAAADQLARLSMQRDLKPDLAKRYLDEALPILIAALDEPQESAAMQAAAALAALGKKAEPARAKLQQAEKNGGEYVKRLSARALANLDQE